MNNADASINVQRVRSGLFIAMLFVIMPWAGLHQPEVTINANESASSSTDIWNESPLRNIAVPENFTFLSYTDYSDVGILINNQSEDSKAIGYAFVAARNISVEKIFLFDNESTPTEETINPGQFDTYFADPLRQMISDRNLTTELNYLVTTKGIPLRINGPGNGKASFDSEIGLINGAFNSTIHQNWWASHTYGPGAGEEMKQFSRQEEGFYLVTRLTGYDVDTALGLITKANNSFGEHGLTVLDLATNRNGSGYKWWNDLLYTTNETMSGMGLPVHFNQNGTYVTNMDNVSMYASWGSNDGSWAGNLLPNSGYDTSDGSWSTGARYWDGIGPSLSPGEQWWWTRQTETKKNGNAAMEGRLEDAPCGANDASTTNGLLAEYFDNNGITYNVSTMVNLSGRTPDFIRHEPNIDWPSTQNAWTGLDSRFLEYWSARHTGIIHIPTDGNWTFYLRSDDGSKLWIDDVEIVDNQGHHAMQERSGVVWLSAGEHRLRTEFFEHGGYAGLELKWEGPGIFKQTVPTNVLTRGSSIPVRESDLIHHWEFDETSGDVANDSIGTAHLNFTGTNGSQWRSCVLGNCAFFDGIDDEARIDIEDSVTDFTVSLWVQANHTGQARHSSAIAVNDVAGDDNSFQIQTGGGSPGNWELYHNNSYIFGAVDSTSWQHLVATFENDRVTLYLDAIEVLNQSVPNGTVNSIEIYKFGVNRAGNTFFTGSIDDVQIWDAALTSSEVEEVNDEIVWICPSFNTTNNTVTYVEQNVTLLNSGDPIDPNHAWVLDGYSMREGWIEGEWWLEVESYDSNGTTISLNSSERLDFSDSWQSRQLRFRPHSLATSFSIRQVAELTDGTYNGSIFFDTLKLYPIRPHFTWLNGSIAETAVSTSGRTFIFNSSYGQSLVADLLEDGVSGVKGYVYEPYLTAIGDPDILLPYYANGYNFAEVNYAANPMISWMGTVVGDPKMAPYSDLVHDVEIEGVRTNGTLSIGINGSIDVILQNIGPGLVDGYLEVIDRNGNSVLANVSLQMPSGNDYDSRRMISINLTPQRVGFNEYVIRYSSNNWLNPERNENNNIAVINTQINGPPNVLGLTCSSWSVHRGGTVGCTTTVEDDFQVTQVRLGWRLNESGDNWTFINSSSSDYIDWYSSLTIPPSIELGKLDLISEVKDEQTQVSLLQLNGAITITNSPHNWHGVHIEGVDYELWSGAIGLPSTAPSGVKRGTDIILKACVVDPDHDPQSEYPMIISDLGNVSAVQQIESQFTDISCYRAIWHIEWGSNSNNDATIYLYDSQGILFSTRMVPIINEPFKSEITLSDLDGNTKYLAKSVNEKIIISLSDPDDFLSNYNYHMKYKWPGHLENYVEGSVESKGSLFYNHSVMLPPPESGLVYGDLEIELQITDSSEGGVTITIQKNWPMQLQPPIIEGIEFCNSEEIPLTRGADVRGWVIIEQNRIIDEVTFNLAQLGNIKSMQSSNFNWHDCKTPNSTNNTYWRFILNADNSFTSGDSTLQIIATDIDGLRGIGEFSIEIIFSQPRIIEQYGNFTVGEISPMGAFVIDTDGHQGTHCTYVIIDTNGTTVMESEGPLDSNGVFSTNWMPPVSGAPFSSTIGCTDAQGHQVAHTKNNIIPNINNNHSNNSNQSIIVNDISSEPKSKLIITMVIGISSTMLIIIITTILFMLYQSKQNELDVITDGLHDNSEWAAPSDSRLEGEQNIALIEMAMGLLEDQVINEELVPDVNQILNSEEE